MLPTLIIDLALILGLAAATTLIFRWLKQPVVLGYILAGYLASNHFGLLPNVQDTDNIHTLAELGIIFLLFGLGLEFSFKKLLKVGGSALITALTVVLGMMVAGFTTGQMLGWNTTDSVFLGGMLSMSSTTIIIKAFGDLGLKSQRFTTLVFGVLVVEDLFAIILMVVLSTIYLGQQIEGGALVWSVVKLLFFLIVWFGGGLYLVPQMLEKAKRWLTGETLLIVALGMCLGMVVLASYVGFSSALGAFIMGSILAETVEAKAIEKITTPVRDLFGAVFFVSVGMLVDPSILVEYWFVILVLTVIVIVGQVCFGSLGMLLSGQPLQVALQSGFSLAQIGEFAFIIATLGVSLGVTSGFLYPVAVAVSVITTFATPFIMKLATPAYRFADAHMGARVRKALETMSSGPDELALSTQSDWKILMNSYLKNILLVSILLSGVVWLMRIYAIPYIVGRMDGAWGDLVAAIVALLVAAPFLWGITLRRIQPKVLMRLWGERHFNRGLILSLVVLRLLVALAFVVVLLGGIYSTAMSVLVGIVLLSVIMALFSRRINRWWGHFEYRLRNNLSGQSGMATLDERNKHLHISSVELTSESLFAGRTIGDLSLRPMYGISVVSIQRGSRLIVVPEATELLMPGDILAAVGSDDSLRSFQKFAEESVMAVEHGQMVIRPLWVRAGSVVVGKSIVGAGIRTIYKCLVVGMERADGSQVVVDARTEFRAGDVVYFAGERSRVTDMLERLSQLA